MCVCLVVWVSIFFSRVCVLHSMTSSSGKDQPGKWESTTWAARKKTCNILRHSIETQLILLLHGLALKKERKKILSCKLPVKCDMITHKKINYLIHTHTFFAHRQKEHIKCTFLSRAYHHICIITWNDDVWKQIYFSWHLNSGALWVVRCAPQIYAPLFNFNKMSRKKVRYKFSFVFLFTNSFTN